MAGDGDFRTRFIFERVKPSIRGSGGGSDGSSGAKAGLLGGGALLHHSHATVSWAIPADYAYADGTTPHRLRYLGDATDPVTMEVTPFEGVSSSFMVAALNTTSTAFLHGK